MCADFTLKDHGLKKELLIKIALHQLLYLESLKVNRVHKTIWNMTTEKYLQCENAPAHKVK